MAGVDESLFSEMWLRCLAMHSLKSVINVMMSKWKRQTTYIPWRHMSMNIGIIFCHWTSYVL